MQPCFRSVHFCCRHGRGYALAESLCALLIVSVGLIPLASVGTTALARLRGHEQLAQAMRAVGEFTEIAELGVVRLNRSDPVSTEGCPLFQDKGQPACPVGGELAIARLAVGDPGSAVTLHGIALWMQP